jgi:hypothetical protein
VAERLDIAPAQFRVVVLRRPKYACRSCEDVVVQAPARATRRATHDQQAGLGQPVAAFCVDISPVVDKRSSLVERPAIALVTAQIFLDKAGVGDRLDMIVGIQITPIGC